MIRGTVGVQFRRSGWSGSEHREPVQKRFFLPASREVLSFIPKENFLPPTRTHPHHTTPHRTTPHHTTPHHTTPHHTIHTPLGGSAYGAASRAPYGAASRVPYGPASRVPYDPASRAPYGPAGGRTFRQFLKNKLGGPAVHNLNFRISPHRTWFQSHSY